MVTLVFQQKKQCRVTESDNTSHQRFDSYYREHITYVIITNRYQMVYWLKWQFYYNIHTDMFYKITQLWKKLSDQWCWHFQLDWLSLAWPWRTEWLWTNPCLHHACDKPCHPCATFEADGRQFESSEGRTGQRCANKSFWWWDGENKVPERWKEIQDRLECNRDQASMKACTADLLFISDEWSCVQNIIN